jgi:DNA-binding NtrC family response regulator
VDDEQQLRAFVGRALGSLGFSVVSEETGEAGIRRYEQEAFDVVLLDLRLGDLDGIDVLRRMKAQNRDTPIVIMTGFGSIQTAVDAIHSGAEDYLTKPLDLDHLEIVLNRVLSSRRQARELELLRSQVERQASFEGMVGVSAPMQRVYDLIRRVADTDVSVVIQGETGTGKELVARAIHSLSSRGSSEFVPINCAAIPEGILEAELFGHEKGTFTGAVNRRLGLIERAAGGTLLLDEIGEMSPALQAKLLRALQEREVVRVGGNQPVPVDFRLLSSTNIDLHERMDQGLFRPDLFYRMSSLVIELPPLRVRRSDIPLLANHFAVRCADRAEQPARDIPSDVMMALTSYHWPGNIRELENAVERAMLMSRGGSIRVPDLPPSVGKPAAGDKEHVPSESPLREARRRFERQYLEDVLRRAGGRVTEAAKMAGINRQHFHEKMKRYGIARRN